jgi:hypothetical protein
MYSWQNIYNNGRYKRRLIRMTRVTKTCKAVTAFERAEKEVNIGSVYGADIIKLIRRRLASEFYSSLHLRYFTHGRPESITPSSQGSLINSEADARFSSVHVKVLIEDSPAATAGTVSHGLAWPHFALLVMRCSWLYL